MKKVSFRAFDGTPTAGAPGARAAAARIPKVAILLCTYNGEQYLAEQLDSFATQVHENWGVWASDDGSKDGTLTILDAYQRRWSSQRLAILAGPGRGFIANFLSLACNPAIDADHYAYSDQDDVWEADKLARAVRWLESVPAATPALYCSRSRYVDENGNELGLSPLFSRPISFANALVQNVGGGNTMVFNRAACALLREARRDGSVASHDWWTYLVVAGCGGVVCYDRYPSLRYRQHGDNLVGMNTGWLARAGRLRMLWRGRFRTWTDGNIAAIRTLQHRLTPENRDALERFVTARQKSLLPRLLYLKRSGVYRQTLFENLGLLAAAVLGKI